MKPTTILIAALASSATAVPVLETRQFGLGGIFGIPAAIFGQGIDLASDIFDSAACAFGTVIGSRSSLCFNQAGKGGGNGKGVTLVIKGGANGGASGGLTGGLTGGISGSAGNSDSKGDASGEANGAIDIKEAKENFGYDFEYKTVGDQYEITITPNSKDLKPCTDKYNKDKGIQQLVSEAAEKCLM
ncbi:uncharacterized protein F5Z01DRAFT_665940, partial [Emericellopsis atlantica]